jgi:hypothetical protein
MAKLRSFEVMSHKFNASQILAKKRKEMKHIAVFFFLYIYHKSLIKSKVTFF